MLSRRELLATTAAFAALPTFSFAEEQPPSNAAAAKLDGLMTAFMQENLRQNPEGATVLGLDTGANADLRSKLRDASAAGVAAAKALNLDQMRRLMTIDPATRCFIRRSRVRRWRRLISAAPRSVRRPMW
jgi:uncharacterized protein (DUF885 family)